MDHGTGNKQLYNELKALAHYIDMAKEELAQLNPANIGSEQIPSATDELDAVIKATEEATSTIMDSCEKIEQIAEEFDDGNLKDKLFENVTNIYEACGFQDITGQRISKVVKTLAHIEGQVDMIVEILGNDLGDAVKEEDDREGDEKLLNGPQMQDQAISQDDIDALLASFD
ncbi:MAG: chemotaxis protein CheZ [Rickettsiales bacterium]|nr:chemotaxis protein CheZ [Rickettsiales bacterium]